MVFLKVIPTSLLFIHGSAGHCNLETRVINSLQGNGGRSCNWEEWREEVEKREDWREEGEGCGLEYGFGFLSLRKERRAIDIEAESEADRVAPRGCTGTQQEHSLDINKVTAGPSPVEEKEAKGNIK